MTGRIVLVRHAAIERGWSGRWVGGGTDVAADPAALATLGPRLARRAQRDPPDRVISSPLRRARETAALLRCAVEIDPRLAERHFGEWEGRSIDDCLRAVAPEFLASTERWLDLPIPGAEVPGEVAARVSEFATELASHPARLVWCVAHAGTIRLIIAAARGISLADAFQIPIPHGEPIELDVSQAARQRGDGPMEASR